jgi:hypothetical protein
MPKSKLNPQANMFSSYHTCLFPKQAINQAIPSWSFETKNWDKPLGQGSGYDNVPSHTTLLVKNISPQYVHVLLHICIDCSTTQINQNISMYMFISESSQNSAIKLIEV